mgnify:CR=1 FL=1
MPLYEYVCNNCEDLFEKLLRMDNGLKKITCPKCESDNVRKKFSTFGMKSGGQFVSSKGCSCGNCSGGNCHSCNCHH